jgi:predicted nucleic acid-binding protein
VAVAAARSFRVVLDTSVLVRGILSSRGPSGYILESFLDEAFDLVLSLSIIAEAESVLRRRHIRARPSFNAEDSHDLLAALVRKTIAAASVTVKAPAWTVSRQG